ncbi:DUF6377 domain-containing protein [Pontibacter silvestris]|uniref:DUF6377 domain-containing protein n=1 Tax=Pontibacter silvestris TaxID=2305183 RepID=A0ABW4X0E1_9BACT|nr:DUF6377 domain-containing protein [Pontibacter silvestris]MCC9136027.1 DUF6377 domain-containing protein [Pontibacter silvestris]
MKFVFFLLILLLQAGSAFCVSGTDSLLNELSHTIENKEVYIKQKKERIKKLKSELKEEVSPEQQFDVFNKLYYEYQSFKYDSAFTYAQNLQVKARQLNDPNKITYAKLKLSFILLSSGMFKETLDSLNTINLGQVPDSLRIDYYALKARAYYDLANYNMDIYYADMYIERGNRFLDSAIALSERNTLQFLSLRGLRNMKTKNYKNAANDFQLILDKLNPSYHQYAIAAASLGIIYKETGETDKAIDFMARASIADIKSSTRETVALMYLAELLYNNGDESRAYTYIKEALEDATFYGARQRQIQVAAILPIIEGERLTTVEGQRKRLFLYATAVTILSVLVVAFAIIIFRQVKQLKQAKRTITEANNNLQEINDHLIEANLIKEEYIGYSFHVYSEYIDKMEKFKKSLDKKLMTKKYDEINHVMKSINVKKEREALYLSFDKIFVKLFPNFVTAFNSYFNEEDKIILKDKDTLNIELRIFALIRIGIHDHEQIARILEYSVNTIYTYKTRVKNRSILPNEEFEKKIMEIKAF